MFHNAAHLHGRSGAGRLVFTTSIIMIFALALTSFSVLAQDDTPVFRVGTNAPVNLEPASGTNDPEILFNRMIYDYLIDLDVTGTPIPALGTSWKVSEDDLTYTVALVEGVTFHDGSAFTAADVVYTFERLKTLESPALSLLSGGAFTVEADGDASVVFTLEEANADFIFGLASRFAFILSEDISDVNTLVEGDAPYANFNGTGPYVLSEYNPGVQAVFTRNESYWAEGQPALNQIEHVYIEDPLAQIDALRSGAVNFIFKIPIDQIPNIEAIEGVTLLNAASNLHPVIRIRTAEGFRGEDVRIRQALKYGLDRDELNEIVLEGLGAIGHNNPIGPAFGAFYDDSIQEPGYDPDTACSLIQEATGEERISFEFYVVDALGYPDLATVMQQQWASACIDVDLLVRPEGVYYGDNEWLDVELGLTGWGDRPIPQQYLLEAYVTGAPFNESNFSNETVDALVAEASATADIEARAVIYNQIAQVFADEGPIIIPYFAPIIGAVSSDVTGLEMFRFPGRTDLRSVGFGE